MRVRFPRSAGQFRRLHVRPALLYVIGLGAYSQLSGLYDELPKYGQRIGDIVDGVQQKIAGMEERTYRILVPARQRPGRGAPPPAGTGRAAARKGKQGAPPPCAAAARRPGAIPEVRIHEESTPIGDYIYAAPELASTRSC